MDKIEKSKNKNRTLIVLVTAAAGGLIAGYIAAVSGNKTAAALAVVIGATAMLMFVGIILDILEVRR